MRVLSSDTSGNYQTLIKALFYSQIELLAYDLFNHIKKIGSHPHYINEIICCCNNIELQMLKQAYRNSMLHFVYNLF